MNDELKKMRGQIVLSAIAGGGGHIASSFSSLEILYALYQRGVLDISPDNPKDSNRDRFILSKGHAALALYTCLAERGFFKKEELWKYAKGRSLLGGEPMMDIPGVETATGSLGHGLSYGAGVAWALKQSKSTAKTYVLLGDGECQEGSVWEAAGFCYANQLDNIVVILDANRLQKMDETEHVAGDVDWVSRWQGFGWYVTEVDGHDVGAITEHLNMQSPCGVPHAIIAHTIKGKGVSIMENQVKWHYRLPSKKELKTVCEELGISAEEVDYAKSLY